MDWRVWIIFLSLLIEYETLSFRQERARHESVCYVDGNKRIFTCTLFMLNALLLISSNTRYTDLYHFNSSGFSIQSQT